MRLRALYRCNVLVQNALLYLTTIFPVYFGAFFWRSSFTSRAPAAASFFFWPATVAASPAFFLPCSVVDWRVSLVASAAPWPVSIAPARVLPSFLFTTSAVSLTVSVTVLRAVGVEWKLRVCATDERAMAERNMVKSSSGDGIGCGKS
ncbi:hypothetical protein C8R43DRAFT_1030753 [Mycena crocata]|nr:hypothetical protein C8R43DRAFT_1030753 [Mycena crocata]